LIVIKKIALLVLFYIDFRTGKTKYAVFYIADFFYDEVQRTCKCNVVHCLKKIHLFLLYIDACQANVILRIFQLPNYALYFKYSNNSIIFLRQLQKK
jgi:hypothetical protein